jgi:RNA recognition motif-containing protein
MNLFIGNLSPETTQEDLRRIFSEFGEVLVARVVTDRDSGLPKGFGFVEMGDKFMAFDAIDNIDATFLHGNIISVKEAKTQNKDKKKPFRSNNNPNSFGYNSNRPAKPYSQQSARPLRPRFKRKSEE